MKNITLIIAFIIGASFALSAQRGGTFNGRPNGSGYGNYGHNNGHNHGHHGNHGNNHGHHGHNYHSYRHYSNHNYGWNAASLANFNTACRSIKNCSYESDRLSSAKYFVRTNYVSTQQIAAIIELFSYERTKLEFAKHAFHRTCDVQNYGIVFDYLTYKSSRTELDAYIRDFQW